TIAAHFEAVHRRHGVGIQLGVSAMRIAAGADGRAVVHASDGTAYPADIVVAAIGGVANDQIARDAGLDCDGGILIDARGLTSDERIVAAGDCAVMRPAAGARALRVESVGNAIEQAKAAAATLCGGEYAADPLAWFWSDQFDLKLQTVGIPDRTAAEIVVGDLAADRFAVCYVRDGRLVAVDAVNLPECLIEAKRLIRSSEPFDETNMRNVAAGAAARAPATGSGR
ncbi:MAG: FAD-dependent oxidoreductase, partial [Alphaproteobacteria bacterium]|nr:FAD-dependent oxidoreductase [Alphaproteobacteria bacterium]